MTLGIVAVIFVSLVVPAWILHVEYQKTYGAPVKVAPAAEVLRERTSETVVIITPHAPPILELAERLVQREAEEREAEKQRAVAHAPMTPQVDSQRSVQAP